MPVYDLRYQRNITYIYFNYKIIVTKSILVRLESRKQF